ncbi:MAG TPA: hypothetical protein VG142_07165 [Trebonia sp.]|jgi:hypothetical protein|nr:hypothetical protein [Trebonia sp.]
MALVHSLPSDPDKAREKQIAAANKRLDQWAPTIDQLVDLSGAAAFLGLKGPDSIRRNIFRTRVDGTAYWPEPDAKFGRSKAWKIRSIVLNRAQAPGRGHPGLAKRRRQPAESGSSRPEQSSQPEQSSRPEQMSEG